MDSLVCLYWAKANYEEVHSISFDYGQRNSEELFASTKLAHALKLTSHRIMRLDLQGGLADPQAALGRYSGQADIQAQREAGVVELSIVPGRNLIFLAIASNRAEELQAEVIVIGLVNGLESDYPDCRPGFVLAAQEAILFATGRDRQGPTIHAPFIRSSKADVVKMSLIYPGCYAHLGYTHSAYENVYPPGNDRASVQRREGFEQAGVPDPLIYRAWSEGKLPELPISPSYDICRRLGKYKPLAQLETEVRKPKRRQLW